MTYLIICLIIFASGYVGKSISSKFKSRTDCFYIMERFANFLGDNISYLSDDIGLIFDKFIIDIEPKFKNDFVQIKNLIMSENFKISDLDIIKMFLELNNGEKQELFNFFKSLGESGKESQIKLINGYKLYLSNKYSNALNDSKQKGSISFKVSISIGVVICILII